MNFEWRIKLSWAGDNGMNSNIQLLFAFIINDDRARRSLIDKCNILSC